MTDKNPQKIKNMFDEISPYYDEMNNLMSLGTHYLIKKDILKKLNIEKHSQILDLCCGTGDFSRIINKLQPSAKVIGLDISSEMLKTAKSKNPSNTFILDDCTNLPFKENEFDYVTIGFGLRNIENHTKALSEIYRVLKPHGKFLHLDFGKHNFAGKIFDFCVPILAKILKKNLSSYSYLISSKNEYPEPDELLIEFENVGLKYVLKRDYIFGAISAQICEK